MAVCYGENGFMAGTKGRMQLRWSERCRNDRYVNTHEGPLAYS